MISFFKPHLKRMAFRALTKPALEHIGGRFLFCLLLLFTHGASGFSGGDGTVSNPYRVSTAEHLNDMRNHLFENFILEADIDLGVAPWNSGEGWQPIGTLNLEFRGVLDGAGFTIRNLTCQRPGSSYQGLFGVTSGAILRRIKLENARITGRRFTGALAGLAENCVLRNLDSTSGIVTGESHVGGLFGSLHGGSLHLASSGASVTGQRKRVGGVMGSAYAADIQRVSSTGEVRGDDAVGGLIGDVGAELPLELPRVLDYAPKSTSAGSPVFVLFDGDITPFGQQITATLDGEPLPQIGVSTTVLQINLPTNAASGNLVFHYGTNNTDALPLVLALPTLHPLFNLLASPTVSNQVIECGGGITITIPPGILDRARNLSVSIVSNAPAHPFTPFMTTAYDISIEGLSQLAGEIRVSLPYDPVILNTSRPTSEQVSVFRWDEEYEFWIEMPHEVDGSVNRIHFLTDHLCTFAVVPIAFGLFGAVYGAVEVVPAWIEEQLNCITSMSRKMNIETTYNPSDWGQIGRWRRPNKLGPANPYDAKQPTYIQDIGDLLDFAIGNYTALGFKDPVNKPGFDIPWRPITVKIGGSRDPYYNKFTGVVHYPINPENKFDRLIQDSDSRYADIGHELFHRVQAEYYGILSFRGSPPPPSQHFWWIEACAEYAGCREAWGHNNRRLDRVFSDSVLANMLSYPLDTIGVPNGWDRDMEYVNANFIRFLVDHKGLDFKNLVERVAQGKPFEMLNKVIGEHSPGDSLALYYQDYATWAALVKGSVLVGFPIADFSNLESPDHPWGTNEVATKKDVLPIRNNQTLRVSLTGASGARGVRIFRIPENQRIDLDCNGYSGFVNPKPFWQGDLYSGSPSKVLDDLPPGEVLYFLAYNCDTASATALTVTLEVMENGATVGSPLSYTCYLDGGFSAKLWAVKLLAGQVEIASVPLSRPSNERWFPTIRSALAAAEVGADIRVYPGVYEEPNAISIDIRKNVTLRSVKGPAETILRGNNVAWDKWIVIYETAPQVTIEGFTIEPGPVRANYMDVGAMGIMIHQNTTPVIRNNRFKSFRAAISAVRAEPSILNNTFVSNSVGVEIESASGAGVASIRQNYIGYSNLGIDLRNAPAYIIGNTIEKGSGGGIHIQGPDYGALSPGKIVIEGNAICYNAARVGGGIYVCGGSVGVQQVLIQNHNVIMFNEASENGGGIGAEVTEIDGGLSGITISWGNTIAGNQAVGDGGGIYILSNDVGAIFGNTIEGNLAGVDGGGVSLSWPFGGVSDDRGVVSHNTITGNRADRNGGGVCAIEIDEMEGNQISGNHAGRFGGGIYGNATNWTLEKHYLERTSLMEGGEIWHQMWIVPTFTPPYPSTHNAVSGNTHAMEQELSYWENGVPITVDNVGYEICWPGSPYRWTFKEPAPE